MNRTDDGSWFPLLQDSDKESPHLGVYQLVGILEQEDREIDVIDWVAAFPASMEEVAEQVAAYDVAFYSANSMNWPTALALAQTTRTHNSKIRQIIGGPHPTHYPESVIRSNVFDAYYRGEADNRITDIYDFFTGYRKPKQPPPGLGFCAQDKRGIPGVHVDDSFDTPIAPPAYARIAKETFLVLPVETSRGCRFACRFCSISSQNNWRGTSWQVAVERLELAHQFIEHCTTGLISIIDNTFTADHHRVHLISKNLDRTTFRKRCILDASVLDLQNEQLVEDLSFFTSDLLVGAEVSSSSQARKINKPVTPRLIKSAAGNLQKFNLASRSVLSFIIGFPWQSRNDCLDVVRFVKDLILEYDIRAYIQWYWPIPGSRVWADLIQRGVVKRERFDEPGLFSSEEIFYAIRDLTADDVAHIGDKIDATKMVLQLATTNTRALPIEYSTPFTNPKSWNIKRDPLLHTPTSS